jgi:hypothetical protein
MKNLFNMELKSRFDILSVDQDDPMDGNAVSEKIRVMYYETIKQILGYKDKRRTKGGKKCAKLRKLKIITAFQCNLDLPGILY